MRSNAAADQVHARGQTVRAAAIFHQLPIALHSAQAAAKDFQAVRLHHFERGHQLPSLKGPTGLLQTGHNGLAVRSFRIDMLPRTGFFMLHSCAM